MTITVLAQSGYVPWNVREFHWIPTVANIAAPTLAELNAATNLSGQVTAAAGWAQTGNLVESQSFVGPALKLAGPPTLEDSSLTFRLSETPADDIRGILELDDEGYIGVYPEGKATGNNLDLFKVQVYSNPKSNDPGEAATIEIQFALIAQPQFDLTVPAS